MHFLLGLPILIAFLIYFDAPIELAELPWFPIAILVQLLLTLGFAFILSALTVHFRDLKDILGNVMTLWFFATPIIYYWKNAPERIRPFLNLNPFTHLAITYQEILFFPTDTAGGPPGHWKWLLALGVGSIGSVPVRLLPLRSPARLVCRGSLIAFMNAIELTNVTKIYRKYARRKQFATLKSALLTGSLIRDLQPDETFPALQGVSFSVPAGRTYAIIGRNGSGKSTALKLVAGITKPTTGTVKVAGRISALIELGAGFHPEISGRENVFINGIMLGLTKREVTRRFDEIVEFAELQQFIDAPVKTYSSGMYMRLGFAVAIHVDPDVLLVDEVLAVGDEGFTHKCLDKFGEFKRRGKTILLVTHSLNLVERFCDEALWLDSGKVRGSGDPKRVVGAYLTDVGRSEEKELTRTEERAQEDAAHEADSDASAAQSPQSGIQSLKSSPSALEDMTRIDEGRWGSREIEITGVTFKTAQGEVSHIFQSGEPMSIHLSVRAHQAIDGFRLRHRHLQRRRSELLRHQHAHGGLHPAGSPWRRRGHIRYREPRSGRRHIQARCGCPQARRIPVRLPPPALHISREIAQQGSGDLPATPRLDVFAKYQTQERGVITKNVKRRTNRAGSDAPKRRGLIYIRFSFFDFPY